jgi:NADPH:quinone reductase-like Zn-dependent oxidoreductase
MLGSTMNGGYAEFVVTPGSTAVKIPDNITYTEAAAIPTVFLPAWSILIRRGRLKPWETVLVVSSSSGVGSAALQVAKNVVGATVIATTSSENKLKISKSLGADAVVNYNSEDVIERIREITGGKGVNVVIDHVGTDAWSYSLPSLATGGRYGICGVTSGYKAELQMGSLFLKNQTIFGSFMGKMADLPRIVELVGRGVLKPMVHETYDLGDAAKAHNLMESREFFGKIMLEVS